MKTFYKKSKYSITLMVILAMLLQVVGPLVSNYAFAEGADTPIDQESQGKTGEDPQEPDREEPTDEEEGNSEEPVEGKEEELGSKDVNKEEEKVLEDSVLISGGIEGLGDIFTSVKLTIRNEGKPDLVIIEDGNNITDVKDDTTVLLEYEYKIPDDTDDSTFKPTDWAEIKIPDAFRSPNGKDMTGKLMDGDIEVGTYTLTQVTNIVMLEFNDELVGKEERGGKSNSYFGYITSCGNIFSRVICNI